MVILIDVKKISRLSFNVHYLLALASILFFYSSCSKHEVLKDGKLAATDSSISQINYLAKIKATLKDSLSTADFSALNLTKLYKSNDVQSKNYFLRLSFKTKKNSDDFILLKTDYIGNITGAKIVHINRGYNQKTGAEVTIDASSLDRKKVTHFRNIHEKSSTENTSNSKGSTANNVSSLMEEEDPVGEQTLPDVVVTGYIYDDPTPYYWYCFDDILGTSTGGGGTYTYGSSDGWTGGGSGSISPDVTVNITYEKADQPPIDVVKYIKCFSLLSNQGALFKITIFTDIPVNSDSYKLFDVNTGACGHTFIQLTKSNQGNTVQQNIGFYPESGWKSIEANGPVASKLVDNAGHEFNASLTINVDAAHFQTALNEIQYYDKVKYDIDNFNCTDFALKIFNTAAPAYLSIPQYHLPGSMYGELSNTPQGLYNELSSLSKTGGYPNGQITVPGVAGYTGRSHGACN